MQKIKALISNNGSSAIHGVGLSDPRYVRSGAMKERRIPSLLMTVYDDEYSLVWTEGAMTENDYP